MPVALLRHMDDAMVLTMGGAALAGLSGSPHCALMCGPLACAGLPSGTGPRLRAAAAWHAGRVAAYSAAGALLGGLGGGVLSALPDGAQRAVPWLMAAGLVAAALDVGRWLRPLPGVGRLAAAITRRAQRTPALLRSALMGAVTPLLPCGLLYGIFLAVAASGSAWLGAGLMAAFALGSAGALSAAQLPSFAGQRFPMWARRGVLLAAAALLIWRGALASPEAPPHCH